MGAYGVLCRGSGHPGRRGGPAPVGAEGANRPLGRRLRGMAPAIAAAHPLTPSRLDPVFQRGLSRQVWKNTVRMRFLELTRFCPQPVLPGAFQCHFKGLRAWQAEGGRRGISPCIPWVWAAIPVGGEVAEWSKALPC